MTAHLALTETSPASVVAGLVAYALSRGVAPVEMLGALGLTPADVAPIDGRLPIAAGIDAWTFLRSRFSDDALPLEVASCVDLSVTGLLGQIMTHSPSVRVALERMVRYQRIQHPSYLITSVDTPEGALLTLVHHELVQRARDPMEFIAAITYRSLQKLAGPSKVRIREVRFGHPCRGPVAPFERFFEAPVHFDQAQTMLLVDPAALDRPVAGVDPMVAQHLVAYGELLLRDLPAATAASPADDVRRAIDADLQAGNPPTSEGVATRLGMSTRTLQRKLAESGAPSFQALYDEARKSAALRLLRRPEVTLYELTFLLHFNDITSMYRAFRRWTGRTPADVRRDLAHG